MPDKDIPQNIIKQEPSAPKKSTNDLVKEAIDLLIAVIGKIRDGKEVGPNEVLQLQAVHHSITTLKKVFP